MAGRHGDSDKLTDHHCSNLWTNTYKRHRFSPEIISDAVWLYYRFNLSYRRCAGPFIEDLLTERGVTVSYESIRLWCIKFGSKYPRQLNKELSTSPILRQTLYKWGRGKI
jgi:transposase-like protein